MCWKNEGDKNDWSRPGKQREVTGKVREVMGDKIMQGLGRLMYKEFGVYSGWNEERYNFEQRSDIIGQQLGCI